jgi:Sec7-like guanine-nucleotide exchange factor
MTKKKTSKKLTDTQVLEKYPNIKQYLETSKEKKNEWDDALRDIIRDENGSFTFDSYFVAFKDSSSTWEDGCENVQWIIEVLNDGVSEFWQVVGYTSSYDGNQFDDYWYDFKKVTPTEKTVTVWR